MFFCRRFTVAGAAAVTGSDSRDCWRRVREHLRAELGNTTFQRWIEQIALDSADGERVVLSAPTAFLRRWIEPHYGDRIRALWRREMPSVCKIEFTVRPELTEGRPETAPDARAAPAGSRVFGAWLDERYSFANFVVGKPNEFAHAAAVAVADGASQYNPLYIFGGVGLGKTHLLQAIGLRACTQRPDRTTIYMSAERFMYEFIAALRAEDAMAFKDRIRSADLLLVDDVQFIGGKEATQEEFFHTFNALIAAGKQVVVSGDRLPGDLRDMDERMRSRLDWGLVAEVHTTSFELRLGILQAWVERAGRGLLVPAEVLELLARRIVTSVRELEGALTSLIAQATLTGQAIDLDTCRNVLRDKLRGARRPVSIEDIQNRVAEYYGTRVSEMRSARRARIVTRPRHVAMYLAKRLTQRSLPEIGRKFGNRDHTTVLNGVKRIEELRKTDPQLDDDVERLARSLES